MLEGFSIVEQVPAYGVRSKGINEYKAYANAEEDILHYARASRQGPK